MTNKNNINKIKNIKDLKNIQIVCRKIDQVEDCYNHLEQLGFKVSYYSREGFFFIVRYNDELSGFSNYGTIAGNKYIEFYNKKFIKTLQKFIKEKEKGKEQEAKTIVEYLRSEPIKVKIDNRQDYDNIINYLDKQGIVWNSGNKLSESVEYDNKMIKFLSFWPKIHGRDKLETGLMWSTDLNKIRKNISVKELFKKFNIKYKELPDFEVAEDGRITKINNWKSEKIIYCFKADCPVNKANQDNVEEAIKYGLVFATAEARDKAMFKLEIETKLKNIAERLNDGRKIDWYDENQIKYSIYYNYNDKMLDYDFSSYRRKQGAIYCLDHNFLEVAKQEIGVDNLIKYFEE